MANEATTAKLPQCKRCHRTLRATDSIARGYGRHCLRLHRQEQAAKRVLASYSAAQVENVKQLLRDGGIARLDRHRFEVVASDGVRRYEVNATTASCTCKAGENGRACYHLAAAQLTAA